MKKLKRKKLDELVKMMPVLTEEEQRSCFGAASYYSRENGMSLGDFGPGDNIRLISSGTYYRLIEANCMGELNLKDTLSWLNTYSFELWSGSLDIRNAVVQQLASDVAISHNVYVTDLDKESLLGLYNGTSGNIYINSESFLFQWGSSKVDLQLLLIHEECHANDRDNGLGSDASEAKAYNAVINHKLFKDASPAFQEHVRRQVERYPISGSGYAP